MHEVRPSPLQLILYITLDLSFLSYLDLVLLNNFFKVLSVFIAIWYFFSSIILEFVKRSEKPGTYVIALYILAGLSCFSGVLFRCWLIRLVITLFGNPFLERICFILIILSLWNILSEILRTLLMKLFAVLIIILFGCLE